VPIIGSAALSLGKDALSTPPAIASCAVAFCLSLFMGISNIILVLLGVACALVWWFIRRQKQETALPEERKEA
jgi:chromate transporter